MRENKQRSEEKPKCVACWCKACMTRRVKIDNLAVNLVHKEMMVNLYDMYAVDNIQRGEKGEKGLCNRCR